jgi:hypothetical protein
LNPLTTLGLDAFAYLSITQTKNNFTSTARDFTFNVHLKQTPQSVKIASQKLKMMKPNNKKPFRFDKSDKAVWMWDDAMKIVRIFVPTSNQVVKVTLQK